MKRFFVLAIALTAFATGSVPAQGSHAGVAPAASTPVVVLALSLPAVFAGETATVRWHTENATSCRASGAWTGAKPLNGEQQVGPLTEPGAFQLDCGNGTVTTSRSVRYVILADRPTSGIGVFDIGCNFSHSLNDDPIVFPGQPGASHMHDFFGFKGTNASSQFQTMRRTLEQHPDATTCTELIRRDGGPPASNASAYWAPAVYVNGQKVDGHHMHIYYRQEFRQAVRVFPPGFRMLVGNSHATPEQAKAEAVIRWWCGGLNNAEIDRLPSDCAGRAAIHAEIRFPGCWDGRIDSPDHKSHIAPRRETGKCPETHPFRLPRILMHVDFDVRDKIGRDLRSTDKITLASGGMWTMHADYLFAWDPFRLDTLIHTCLNARVNCKLDPPGSLALVVGGSLPPDSGPATTTTTPTTKGEPGGGKPAQLETTLKILDTSPNSPRAGDPFSLTFAAVKGDARLKLQSVHCDATAGSTVVPLKRKTLTAGVGTCIWDVPAAAGKTFRATIGGEVDGHNVHGVVEDKIR